MHHADRGFLPIAAVRRLVFAAAAVLLIAGALYTALFGVYDDIAVRVGSLSLGILVLLIRSLERGSDVRRFMDLGLLLLFVWPAVRYFQLSDSLESGMFFPSAWDIAAAVAAIVVLLELTRRAVGLPLVLVCAVATAYALFGAYLPGVLRHSGVNLNEFVSTIWYSFDGVFGRPLAVVSTNILVFIIFGVALEALGIGAVLLKTSVRGLGWLPGGSAHAAVMASALFGSISGSVVGNVVGTGVVTIPMIKRTGFSAGFAGAVEAAASSGGQIMPPVMGAVAFVMADMTGVPYLYICLAALLPAIFYYASLFACISVEARRLGLKRLDRSQLPVITPQEWLMTAAFVVPLVVIVAMMASGRSPQLAGFWGLATAIVLGLVLNPEARSWTRLRNGIERAATASAIILVAVAAVGIVIGVMNLTGLGLRFAAVVQALAHGSLFLSLLAMAAACIVLGMGVPTVPAYLIIVLVMGPAIEALGVPMVAAHMFVVYFAVMSMVTPPVALAAYAAASIADANPMDIGLKAVKLSLIGFLVPFAFVYNPSLLLITHFAAAPFAWAVLRLVLAGWVAALMMGGGFMRTAGGMALAGSLIAPVLWLQVPAAAVVGGMTLAGTLLRRGPVRAPARTAD